jgi:hypothetical protein
MKSLKFASSDRAEVCIPPFISGPEIGFSLLLQILRFYVFRPAASRKDEHAALQAL